MRARERECINWGGVESKREAKQTCRLPAHPNPKMEPRAPPPPPPPATHTPGALSQDSEIIT